ncbi:MAG: hypothetical protein HXY43_25115 [Fischerella sp.]|jgi:hypothetical protein|uniref:hypothetical protein n=1 Tax=Fischerella sp. TaxID=1191 RepID=UPI00184F3D33|nr:hypothetical protein [Fischerella sp.]NWF62432.1 hypothetical protein [Fischerella sp.]
MSWYPYNLDREAQRLVLKYRNDDVIKESHRMRTTVAYGLERFWGEHLRLLTKSDAKEQAKGRYWCETWQKFATIMTRTGITLPKNNVSNHDTEQIQAVAQELWNLSLEDQRICLAVLTQFCDSLVWWTQRYKRREQENVNDDA